MDDADTTRERALRSTAARLERQLETAQQITHIGSFEWDMATGRVTWSDELYRIYGLPPRSIEVTLDIFLGRVHPEDRDRVQAAVQGALARGGRFAYRERIVRPDGAVRELDTIGEVVQGDGGAPVGLIGTCRDVTEERRREETIRLYADIVDRVSIGMSVWRCDTTGDPASLRLVAFNRATEAATGVELAGAIGRTLPVIFPAMMATELPALMAAVDDGAPVRELMAYRFGAGTFAVKIFAVPDLAIGLALEDITERARAQRVQDGEQRALEMLAAGAPLGDILGAIVAMIEEAAPPGTIGSILLLDATGTRVVHGAAPGLPDAYNLAIDGAPIGPKAGSCGTAAYRREPVFVDDIATDPLWDDYRALADQFGLRACWSWPILATDGGVLGTFAMYHHRPCKADPTVRTLIARAAHVAAIAIERRQLDDRLAALSERIEAIREDERTGIAREIHDELGQALTALKMDIAWVGRRVDAESPVATKLGEMSRATDEIIGSVRRISAELRPGILDDLGLRAAIEWQAEEFTRRTGVPCQVRAEIGDLRLERGLATTVFRIFQEALTNVARHASATKVDVALSLERGNLRLEVSDDGVGVPPGGPRSGALGLLGMRERARRAGGDFTVGRGPSGGTRVTVTVPLRFPSERASTGS
jgi:PAS domain S-box-containing protein